MQHLSATLDDDELIERLSQVEHEQWTAWSKSVASDVGPERLNAWQSLWVPYEELSDEQKELDRHWARRALAALRAR